jgi:hypothetical protein
MPILVYPKGRVNENAMNAAFGREGWFRISDAPEKGLRDVGDRSPGGYRPVPGSGTGSSLLLENQLVVGFSNENYAKPRRVSEDIARINERMGPHVNPLAALSEHQRVLRSPGSSLVWVWLVPSHVIHTDALSVRAAAFPWKSAESLEMRERRIADMKRELKHLEELQAAALRLDSDAEKRDFKRKHEEDRNFSGLDPKYLARISELRELIAEAEGQAKPETLEDKSARLARQRAELDAEIKRKHSGLMGQIAEVKEELEELGIPKAGESSEVSKRRRKLASDLKKLNEQYEAIRIAIIRKMVKK